MGNLRASHCGASPLRNGRAGAHGSSSRPRFVKAVKRSLRVSSSSGSIVMLRSAGGKTQHYGAAAEVLKAMQQKSESGAAQPAGGGANVLAIARSAQAGEPEALRPGREERAA